MLKALLISFNGINAFEIETVLNCSSVKSQLTFISENLFEFKISTEQFSSSCSFFLLPITFKIRLWSRI